MIRRSAFVLCALWVFVAAPSWAAKVVNVRVGQAAHYDRIVIDLDGWAAYQVYSVAGSEIRVRLLAETEVREITTQKGLIRSVRVTPAAQGSEVMIRLNSSDVQLKDMMLQDPYRIVIDVRSTKALTGPEDERVAPDDDDQPRSRVAIRAENQGVVAGNAMPQRSRDATNGRRVALVVGNGGYQHTRSLANTIRDAKAVADTLKSLGFSVRVVTDSSTGEFKGALRAFRRDLSGARLALFYYAGHAVQMNGKNYLLPVNAKVEREADLEYDAVSLGSIMSEMESGSETRILILDACRDNPFVSQLSASLPATRSASVSRGLSIVRRNEVGTIIAYATAPGRTAEDGDGSHSPYTDALLKWIGKPGLEITEVFRRVREEVVRETSGQQIPWENSSLIGDGIYLVGDG